jgi:hypothetical protein
VVITGGRATFTLLFVDVALAVNDCGLADGAGGVEAEDAVEVKPAIVAVEGGGCGTNT